MITLNRRNLDYLRYEAKRDFEKIKPTIIEAGSWVLPHRIKWLQNDQEGERNNRHIADPYHLLAMRSCVAGFLEGNTSASRPWIRYVHRDETVNRDPINRAYLDKLARLIHAALARSNFYDSAGQFYYDYIGLNTGGTWIDELSDGRLFFHNMMPGSFYAMNDPYGVANICVREYSLTVKALVERFGKRRSGGWEWGNFSKRVRKMYEDGDYSRRIDVCTIAMPNEHLDPSMPMVGLNRPWLTVSYESPNGKGDYAADGMNGEFENDIFDDERYLEIKAQKRKPFIVGRTQSSNNFPYGEKGPTTDVIGLIKSLQVKALGKDRALEQMVNPTLTGPASLRRNYITNAAGQYIPQDLVSMAGGNKLQRVFEINPAIAAVVQDVGDLRNIVDKFYFADFLLFLSMNQKTRTATEVDAIVREQQLVIGPNLQALNFTYNDPITDYVADYVIDTDRDLGAAPPDLEGEALRTEYISVFAQAQRAADMPSIREYWRSMVEIGQINPQIFDKVNLDRLADIYEDRLFLPAGINRSESEVERIRSQKARQAQMQQMMTETLPAMAGAAKDVGIKIGGQQ